MLFANLSSKSHCRPVKRGVYAVGSKKNILHNALNCNIIKFVMNTIASLFLKEHNIIPTPQRVAVYASLLKRYDHPTADILFNDLRATMPSLSRTTVYTTLKLLVDNRLVQEIRAENGEMRYDGHIEFHAHFKCRNCGGLFDIDVGGGHSKYYAPMPKGYVVEVEQLTYYGICPNCSKKKGLTK